MQTLTNESAPTPVESSRKTARDPVCGMDVDLAQPKGGTSLYEGQLYGFCNPKCREKFEAHPEQYLRRRKPAVIVSLVLLGQVLELRARSRTRGALQALLGLAPKTARLVLDDGAERDQPPEGVSTATGFASGRARRCRWTASSSKARQSWTSRW